MSPLSQPTVRRPRTDAVNLTANSPAQVEQTQVVIEPALREYLASEREAALANGNGPSGGPVPGRIIACG
ncbi:unnamed protein product [Acanthoscelides obtectus]|uniref:Uncharacterized protein n=1 Tax=Acanthoscelides obtectus TaxID=200917 RepID=A0A9P0VUG2_ACAOB|nr:unnamed protein product [Acanthoscelides obtectus]CAK1683454.1 hypothetical protein AOBTE_LOCUS34261 [Acanthoscelides obtectus]